MATYYKRSTVTTLGSTSAWSTTGPTGVAAAAVPTSADQAQWDAASLGGALTGNLTAGTLQINGATANITHSAGTLNLYSVNIPSTTRTFSSSGSLNMNGGTWSFDGRFSPGDIGGNISLTGTLGAPSTSTTLSRSSGSSWATFRYTPPAGVTSNIKLNLGNYACFKFLNYNSLTAFGPDSYIQMDSSTARISTESNGSGVAYITCPIKINSNVTFGPEPFDSVVYLNNSIIFNSGGPYNIDLAGYQLYNVDFSSGSGNNSISGYGILWGTTALGTSSIVFNSTISFRTISFNGPITGTNGLTKSGPGELYIPYDAGTTLTGVVNINDGLLTVAGNGLPTVSSFNIADTGTLEIRSSSYLPTVSGNGNIYFSDSGTTPVPIGYFLNSPTASLGYGVGSPYGNEATPAIISIQEFPNKLLYYITGYTGRAEVTWNSASSVNYSGDINIFTKNDLTKSALNNNQANSSHTVTISGQINIAQASTHTFVFSGSNTGDNTVSSVIPVGAVGDTISFAKEGSGKWILSGANTFKGSVTLNAGTLTCTNSNALGSSSSSAAVTLTSGTLQLSGGTDINKVLSTVNYGGATVQNLDGFNSIEASSHVLNANTSFNISSGTLYLWGPVAGASTYTLTKTGSGDLELNNSSSGYLGPTTISSGRLIVSSIQNPGISSSLGAPASAQATITMGSNATLAFNGESSSTTRNISSSAASGSNCTLENSGTGALTYASGGTFVFSVAGTHTLELSGSCTTESNFGRTLANSTSAVSLLKSGAGAWLMSGNMTATGSITITGGDFRITGTTTTSHNVTCGGNSANFGSTNRTFASLLVSSGTVSITAGNTISAPTTMSGGTITAVLTGANTLTITSGASNNSPATIQPNDTTNGNNAFTGSVSINGCVDLATSSTITPSTSGRGRVLGTSNTVTVSSTGIIRTKTGPATNQRGQVRYNNLTFQSGSTIKIGKAA